MRETPREYAGRWCGRRDAIWHLPDLLPAAEDLDEQAGFIDPVIGDTGGAVDN
jgi:uncharacterized protein (DUF2342 family)